MLYSVPAAFVIAPDETCRLRSIRWLSSQAHFLGMVAGATSSCDWSFMSVAWWRFIA